MKWEDEFRHRIKTFKASSFAKGKGLPVSIKIRVTIGCYHRSCSPNAYRAIDEYLSSHPFTEGSFQEHESGPELLVYLSLGAAGISFASSVISLVSAIIKARSEGIKRGDRPSAPLELIVRGFDNNGNLKEEKILKIHSNDSITKKQGDYKRSGTKLQSFLVKFSKISSFL